MRKLIVLGASGAALLLSGCGQTGLDRERPDEFAVARQAPLVIPPDYALVPPQPGAPRPQDSGPAAEALDALFGGTAPRSAGEAATLERARASQADPGVRSAVGDPDTTVVNKGATTRDIVAAPQGDGQDARAVAGTPAEAPAPAAAAPAPVPTPTPTPTPE